MRTYRIQLLNADLVIDEFSVIDASDPDVFTALVKESASKGKKPVIGRDLEYLGSQTANRLIAERLLDKIRKFELENKNAR